MTTDGFREILINAGEQGIASDMNLSRRQVQMAMRDMMLIPRIGNMTQVGTSTTNTRPPELTDFAKANLPLDIAFCPFPASAFVAPGAGSNELTLGTDGPLVQLFAGALDDPDEADSPTILIHWASRDTFPTLTTAVGDATNPRLDIVEMKLEEVTTNEDRVFTIESVRAELDLGAETTNVDTIIRCPIGGRGGNNVSIAFAATGTGVGSLTRDGNAFTFEYETAVTTVEDFEDAITALSLDDKLIEIESAGTPANVFADPDDTITATHLAGGVDPIVASSNIAKTKRVQATFQIKAGTPAATPAYPAPTAGFVPIAAVLVAATHNATHDPEDMRDLRWPLGGVRIYDVMPRDMTAGAGANAWSLATNNSTLTSPAGASLAYADLREATVGRLVGFGLHGEGGASVVVDLITKNYEGGGSGYGTTNVVEGTGTIDTYIEDQGGTAPQFTMMDAIEMMDHGSSFISAETRAPNTRVGTPWWTNGERAGPVMNAGENLGTYDARTYRKLAVSIEANAAGSYVHFVRFFVAHGMG